MHTNSSRTKGFLVHLSNSKNANTWDSKILSYWYILLLFIKLMALKFSSQWCSPAWYSYLDSLSKAKNRSLDILQTLIAQYSPAWYWSWLSCQLTITLCYSSSLINCLQISHPNSIHLVMVFNIYTLRLTFLP